MCFREKFKGLFNRKLSRQKINANQKMLKFYSRFIFPNSLVFDVGANIGNRTNIFLQLESKVIAIEPQIKCVNTLNSLFGKNENLTIIQKALGSSKSEAELMICDTNTLSSLSKEWVESVKSSGRFSDFSWKKKEIVQLTTLDELIKLYGEPDFIKIDVEGFEEQVLAGLSRPIKLISLEFAPEFSHSTFKCLDYLESLGEVLFNYSLGESMQFELEHHATFREMISILNKYKHSNKIFGDIYCHFLGK